MKNFTFILSYLKPQSFKLFLNVFFNILAVIFGLFSFLMIIPFLNILFGEVEPVYQSPDFNLSAEFVSGYFGYYMSQLIANRGEIAALVFICVVIASTSFLKNLFRYIAIFFLAPVRNSVPRDIRRDLYDKVLALPLSFFSEDKKGDMMTRMSSDVQELEWSVLNTLESLIKEPVSLLGIIIILFILSPVLTLFVLVLLPITVVLIGWVGRKLKNVGSEGQSKLGDILSIIDETLNGLRIIKAFNAEDHQKKKFREENQISFHIFTWIVRRRELSSPLSEFLGTGVVVLVLYAGGTMILGDVSTMHPSTFIGFILFFTQIIQPVKNISSAYYQIQKGLASAERIRSVLNTPVVIRDYPGALEIKSFESGIEYRDVSFGYEKEPVLKEINVSIAKGKILALVGRSGSGKSTFADLLLRFYDVTGGQILIDGRDIREYKIRDLREQIGMVSQDAILFNDTLFNNIKYGNPNAGEGEVIQAAKIANAHDFITRLENGYDTNIGDGGNKLSGGERQRVTIARAILKNPPILILDEATSSLDTESEKLVQDAIFNLMKNRTTIVIAHRLSTVQHADEIVVLDEGQIIERGSHALLMDFSGGKGVYRKLVKMQEF